jgi:hypothetical protein
MIAGFGMVAAGLVLERVKVMDQSTCMSMGVASLPYKLSHMFLEVLGIRFH